MKQNNIVFGNQSNNKRLDYKTEQEWRWTVWLALLCGILIGVSLIVFINLLLNL